MAQFRGGHRPKALHPAADKFAQRCFGRTDVAFERVDSRLGPTVGHRHRQFRQALCADPHAGAPAHPEGTCPSIGYEPFEHGTRGLVGLRRRHETEYHQGVMQFVLVPEVRPRFRTHPPDRLRVETAQVRCLLHRQMASRLNGQRAPLFGRGIVQEGVRPGAQHLLGQWRGTGQLAAHHLHFAGLDTAQQGGQSSDVHGPVQAVLQGLRHQRVIRDLALAGQVFRAGQLIGKHRSQQVLGVRALKVGGRALAVAEPPDRQRNARVPAPASREDGGGQHGLGKHVRNGRLGKVANHFLQGKAMHNAKRDDDGVLQRRRLKLEVEPPAEPFSERQTPGAIEARSIGRMNDDMSIARLVEEALDDDSLRGGQRVQGGARRSQVFAQLFRSNQRQRMPFR